MRSIRRTWTIGGIGLIVCGVLGMLRTTVPTTGAIAVGVIDDLLYAAAVLIFAFGLSRDASVVARRPLGASAMVIVALWPLLSTAIWQFFPDELPVSTSWTVFGYISLLVPTAAALIAATQIERLGVVPGVWRWAPMWALAAQAVAWALPQIAFVSLGSDAIQASADLFFLVGALGSLTGTLGLGILALVLAAQQRPDTVEVFRSA